MDVCRSCKAPVRWLKTRTGGRMIVNAETVKPGDLVFDPLSGHVSHWATCPHTEHWRTPRPRRKP